MNKISSQESRASMQTTQPEETRRCGPPRTSSEHEYAEQLVQQAAGGVPLRLEDLKGFLRDAGDGQRAELIERFGLDATKPLDPQLEKLFAKMDGARDNAASVDHRRNHKDGFVNAREIEDHLLNTRRDQPLPPTEPPPVHGSMPAAAPMCADARLPSVPAPRSAVAEK